MKTLKTISLEQLSQISIMIWIICQLLFIYFFWDAQQHSDQGGYIKIATECYEKGGWYPADYHLNAKYIWAPGFINYLILQLKLFGTLKINYFLNLLMNIGILWNIRNIARHWFDERTVYISTILFCIVYSNYMIVLLAGTEVPFLFLAISAISLSLSKNIKSLFLAGCFLAIANWIRPLSLIFVLTIIVFLYFNKSKLRHYLSFVLPMIAIIVVIGCATKKNFGYFVFQSTTTGVNLIMTANDKAYGGVSTSLYNDTTSTCYVANSKNLTFKEKDSIRTKRALEWIKKHPLKYGFMFILKIGGLFIEDSWVERPILGGDSFVDNTYHGNTDKRNRFSTILNMALKSLGYYFVLLLFFYSLYKNMKEILSNKGYLILLFTLGILITCIFAISPRYHYPIMFVTYIWGAYGLNNYINSKFIDNEKHNITASSSTVD
jgi:hypothetical protein